MKIFAENCFIKFTKSHISVFVLMNIFWRTRRIKICNIINFEQSLRLQFVHYTVLQLFGKNVLLPPVKGLKMNRLVKVRLTAVIPITR